MRILVVNKYLYAKGGSETHLLGLSHALRERGHTIQFFGTEHPDNVTPPEHTVTVPLTTYNDIRNWPERVQAFPKILFSGPAYHRMQVHLSDSRPAVAHLHNIYHQLSPSVLVALHEAGIPTILTAHDYKLVCPSYSLHDGDSQCFACRGHRYWNVLLRGCSRKGPAGDLALAAEAYVHHFLRIYEQYLDMIIAPSRFLRDRLIEGGYSPARVRVLPNSVAVSEYDPRPEPGDYLLFVGRLSYEKGLRTLIDAAQCVANIPLWVVGEGPLRGELERQAAGLPKLRFLGRQSAQQVKSLLGGCRALVLSSEVPENCPLSVLEAFASAKPVIATRVGGVPELFDGPPTGMLVPPRDAQALASAMQQFWDDPDLCWHCGTQARKHAEMQHDLKVYVKQVEAIYESLAKIDQSAPAVDGTDCVKSAAGQQPSLPTRPQEA